MPGLSVRPACASDVTGMVRVHTESFQGFFLTLLGPAFLVALYRAILGEPDGCAYVATHEGEVVGFVAGASRYAATWSRLVRRRWVPLTIAAIPAVVRRPSTIRRLLAGVRRAHAPGCDPEEARLMSVAVLPQCQGQAVGQRLVAAFVDEMRTRLADAVTLTTDRDGNDRANRFYTELGFLCQRTFTASDSRAMNLYRLDLQERGECGRDAGPDREPDRVRQRYARRKRLGADRVLAPLLPDVYMANQEIERALIHVVHRAGLEPVEHRRVLEIGCGSGDKLLALLKLGFSPEGLVGNELLEERAAEARLRLPAALTILPGDAACLDIAPESLDAVCQFLVFTSLLDPAYQERLAKRMWSWVKPGGGILWYDFVWNNPRNPDVRGVPVRRVRELFPAGDMRTWRVTLAPPLSRPLTRLHPALYSLVGAIPFLRSHVVCWIQKPADPVRTAVEQHDVP